MSGRWRGPESPPHSPPTAELERGRGERRGLRPAPQAPEPPWSLALRSPFPVRIPELGTQPALAHPQPDGGATAPGETRAKPGPSAPASRALGSSVPRSLCAQPPATGAQRPPSAPLCPSSLLPGSSSPARAAPSRPFPQSPRKSNSERPAGLPRWRGPAERAWRGEGQSAAPGGCCPERAGTGALRLPVSGAWGQTRGSPPEHSPLPGTAGDSPGTFGPDSFGAGVQVTSLPTPAGGRCPAASLRLRLRRAPAPHPPTPSIKSVTAFLPSDVSQSLRAVARSWLQCQARQTRGCPAPPSRGPLRWARPGRRAASSRSPSPERGARSASPPSRLP